MAANLLNPIATDNHDQSLGSHVDMRLLAEAVDIF